VSAFTRHRRSGRVIATFAGFEADLLRSLASLVATATFIATGAATVAIASRILGAGGAP